MKFQDAAQAQSRIIVSSSDVGIIQADFYEREAGVRHVSVSPVALAREGRVEATREALQAITASATEIFQDKPSRDTNAQLNAIKAHLEVLRVSEHGVPFHVRKDSPMEKMVCMELQATMEEVYQRQKFDGRLAAHTLLRTLAAYGTFSDRKEFTPNARHTVDDAFFIIANRMSAEERQELRFIARRNFVPELAVHVDELLDRAGYGPGVKKDIPQPETLTL